MGILGGLQKKPSPAEGNNDAAIPTPQVEKSSTPSRKWNLGILSDPLTDEVPGRLSTSALLRLY
jgi:hypothetical protein